MLKLFVLSIAVGRMSNILFVVRELTLMKMCNFILFVVRELTLMKMYNFRIKLGMCKRCNNDTCNSNILQTYGVKVGY